MKVIYTIAGVLLFALTTGALSISDFMNKPAEKPTEQTRFDRAARDICGINAAWEEVSRGVIQCFQHNGRKSRRGEIK